MLASLWGWVGGWEEERGFVTALGSVHSFFFGTCFDLIRSFFSSRSYCMGGQKRASQHKGAKGRKRSLLPVWCGHGLGGLGVHSPVFIHKLGTQHAGKDKR